MRIISDIRSTVKGPVEFTPFQRESADQLVTLANAILIRPLNAERGFSDLRALDLGDVDLFFGIPSVVVRVADYHAACFWTAEQYFPDGPYALAPLSLCFACGKPVSGFPCRNLADARHWATHFQAFGHFCRVEGS